MALGWQLSAALSWKLTVLLMERDILGGAKEGGCFVDRRFLRVRLRWPMAVDAEST